MPSLRVFPAALALSLALVACQSADKKADKDEVKVVKGVEAVCAAQADVDAAVGQVNGLTPDSTVADAQKAGDKLKDALSALNKAEGQLEKAEVKEYRDQVEIFRKAVDEVSKKKDLTLAAAAEQLKGKAAPLIAAREQLASTTVCIDVVDDSSDDKSDAKSDDKSGS
ncbi:hypothetical protein MITS9509_00782 [Synechococcus sp. MIT S9509]|uniref:hypothetical protein n=1 Tax=unclassified Synechococcus TaxID=2626047 RepID=UPI0007BB61D6|nr:MULTISPECIES: hypothetical protein [unclassified Synechococcus]KZR86839.1 hypothetical protein MITS9504_00925 [Synechococcus sp. MIT S9504]KZR92909.1 hypothetical protein MITS9509_00782 [Synechococcus sp. MIT S9509]